MQETVDIKSYTMGENATRRISTIFIYLHLEVIQRYKQYQIQMFCRCVHKEVFKEGIV